MRRLIRSPARSAPPPSATSAAEQRSATEAKAAPHRRLKAELPAAALQFPPGAGRLTALSRLAGNPHLLPSAFSHLPGNLGGPLCAAEAEWVMAGRNIQDFASKKPMRK